MSGRVRIICNPELDPDDVKSEVAAVMAGSTAVGDGLTAPLEGHQRVAGAIGLVVIVERIVPP